ncbi:MAG: putative glycoside hydrolase [Lawsonibacter sp.]|nr:putative glycoside hydrolase [Lawsonibacter sp.]
MRRYRSGYGGYRGRRTLNDILRLVAIGLGVLVVLVLAGLFLGQNYIAFTDSGLRLELPFLQQGEGEPVDPGSVNVVVQPENAQPKEPEPEPEQPPVEAPIMAAVGLSVDAVLDGTAPQKLEQAGANALILDMKNEEGKLGWISQQEIAVRSEVNAKTDGINEALRAWNQGEVYTVARVCCFRDNTVPYQSNDLALRATYGNWRDELGLRWLNPDSTDARAYLAGLCGELAQLGFDEILLDCYAFPTQGRRTAIVQSGSYQSGQFSQVTEAFLDEVRQAVKPYGTVLSVQADRAVFTGENTDSGLTAAGLERGADRIWMTEDGGEPALLDLLSSSGMTQPEKRLVEVVSALSAERKTPQAMFGGQ